jgi:thiol-disulfide isomerase/thioredoxin
MLVVGLGAALLLLVAAGHGARASRSAALVPVAEPGSGASLIGTLAPEWHFERWLRSRPLSQSDLRGKVVLVRWWTDGCLYCETTLPAIEALKRRYGEDLVTIGVFHPKPPGEVTDARVLAAAKRRGYGGPIAIDPHWAMLERWWLDGDPARDWTSVSFLIDRDGVIRWVHGGGEYHASHDPRHARCDADLRDLERAITVAIGRARRPAS